ncbi:phenylalanyl-tRNA synthetase subunit alpha [Tamlana sedimentorum]|uniref:Phenylalanyl-tRNA synthetase subunit alpha n=1 Tax=Neotamlana sedimentorum TaxID=1435349 RepID=A0A0D7WC23_9FLAO|nr:YciI family protein [Tamlana sedimentorum]KJD36624.1 phenylalanyl-tRNA synthetase subunit alpha [Tamlana sedimentorum]
MKQVIAILVVLLFFMSCKNDAKNESSTINLNENTTTNIDSIEKTANEIVEKPVKISVSELKTDLTNKGFKIFDYVDEETKDTVIMQQYFIAFLKKGPIRGQNEEEAADLQKEHLAHLKKMYDLGYADISGPFGDDGTIRGITIYNVPTLKMADSLANSDPMVKAGRLEIEIHPWWAAKGFPLR